MMMRSVLYKTNTFSLIFMGLFLLKQLSCGQTCRPTRTHYSDSGPICLSSFSFVLKGEAPNTNLIVFGVPQQGLKLTINQTSGELASHCTTDSVPICWSLHCIVLRLLNSSSLQSTNFSSFNFIAIQGYQIICSLSLIIIHVIVTDGLILGENRGRFYRKGRVNRIGMYGDIETLVGPRDRI